MSIAVLWNSWELQAKRLAHFTALTSIRIEFYVLMHERSFNTESSIWSRTLMILKYLPLTLQSICFHIAGDPQAFRDHFRRAEEITPLAQVILRFPGLGWLAFMLELTPRYPISTWTHRARELVELIRKAVPKAEEQDILAIVYRKMLPPKGRNVLIDPV